MPQFRQRSFFTCVRSYTLYGFRCTHDFTSLCTKASLHVCLVVRDLKQDTSSRVRPYHLRRCHPPLRKAEGRYGAMYLRPPFHCNRHDKSVPRFHRTLMLGAFYNKLQDIALLLSDSAVTMLSMLKFWCHRRAGSLLC